MKLYRKPSLKKKLKAHTTSRIKRKAKSVIPTYGQYGYIKNPKKSLYNKLYKMFTFGFWR